MINLTAHTGKSCSSNSSTQPDLARLGRWPDLDPLDHRTCPTYLGCRAYLCHWAHPTSFSLGQPISPKSSDRSSSFKLSGRSGLSVNGFVGPLGLSDRSGLSSPPNTSRAFGSPNPCVSLGSSVLLGPSDSLACLSCQAHLPRLCHQVTPVCLGHRVCLCCPVGLIRLECLASPTCHGCRIYRVRLGLSPECEVG